MNDALEAALREYAHEGELAGAGAWDVEALVREVNS